MKRRIVKISAVLAAVSLAFAGAFALRQSGETQSEANIETSYLVRAYSRDKIAVFAEGGATPFRVIECHLGVLPEADAAALRRGLRVSGDDGVRSLIEDITG